MAKTLESLTLESLAPLFYLTLTLGAALTLVGAVGIVIHRRQP